MSKFVQTLIYFFQIPHQNKFPSFWNKIFAQFWHFFCTRPYIENLNTQQKMFKKVAWLLKLFVILELPRESCVSCAFSIGGSVFTVHAPIFGKHTDCHLNSGSVSYFVKLSNWDLRCKMNKTDKTFKDVQGGSIVAWHFSTVNHWIIRIKL